jgi:phosphoribosylglycinamide formyltransferase-1
LSLNICVFASGSGTNLHALIKASIKGIIKSKIVLIISNNSNSGALKIAEKYKIPHLHLSSKLFKSESELADAILLNLKKYKINFIVLAGYMKLLNSKIIKKFKNKIINIHPALLPSYGGKGMFGINVHTAVLNNKEKITGATVHLVNEVYDSGLIILQKKVKVMPSDTPEILQKRVLKTEHKILPQAVKLFELKKIYIRNNKVYFKKDK